MRFDLKVAAKEKAILEGRAQLGHRHRQLGYAQAAAPTAPLPEDVKRRGAAARRVDKENAHTAAPAGGAAAPRPSFSRSISAGVAQP
mmetsp:Transcript_36183/g.116510  ORF Transcript_36183/g.116510 Transcript_36183/m.116510 type:complete len:87 (-) Transcript_36183:392-652(-)